ncbi:MAG: hypothetical protein GXO73_11905, partial [Calditrichaeota bacterium]|nr:hypothetical protein [Calditrichota bacterium]
ETQPKIFDGIYTGTETRDPVYTHQNLQPYQSYSIFRFLSNVAPGKNGGGWVDPLRRGTLDRYAQQLRLTLLAGAKEITLFHWHGLFRPVGNQTSFLSDLIPVAGATFEEMDRICGNLQGPTGLLAYKPLHSSGEEFLPSYLGMLGIPLELSDRIPPGARQVLFTASAADDPQVLDRFREILARGGEVIVTSGLVKRLKQRGIEEFLNARVEEPVFVERTTDLSFREVFRTAKLLEVPRVVAPTNDAWPEVLGVTRAGTAVPLLTRTNYRSGTVWLLTVPVDFAEWYFLPRETLAQVKQFLLAEQPVVLDAPAKVSLFLFDSGVAAVQSFLEHSTRVRLLFAKPVRVTDVLTGQTLRAPGGQSHCVRIQPGCW